MKRFLLLLLSATGILIAAPAAAASTWTALKLPDPNIRVALYGIDCPTASLCIAVGANNTIAATRNPTGAAGGWTVGQHGGSAERVGPPGGEVTYAGR